MDRTILTSERVGRVQDLRPESSGTFAWKPDTKVLCIHRGRNLRVDGCLVRQTDKKPEREPYVDPAEVKRVNALADELNYAPSTRAEQLAEIPRERHPGMAYVGDYCDQFDGNHYIVAPGFFTTTWDAAQHFKARAVVPGSRNPETQSQVSFITILGEMPTIGLDIPIGRRVDDVDQWTAFTDQECAEYEIAGEALDRGALVDPIEPDVRIVPTLGENNEAVRTRSRVKSAPTGRSTGRRTDLSGPGVEALAQKNKPGTNEAIDETNATRAERAAELVGAAGQ